MHRAKTNWVPSFLLLRVCESLEATSLSPWNMGQIILQAAPPARLVYWPTAVSRTRRGKVMKRRVKPYGMKKAPGRCRSQMRRSKDPQAPPHPIPHPPPPPGTKPLTSSKTENHKGEKTKRSEVDYLARRGEEKVLPVCPSGPRVSPALILRAAAHWGFSHGPSALFSLALCRKLKKAVTHQWSQALQSRIRSFAFLSVKEFQRL